MKKWLNKYASGGPIQGPKVPPIKLAGTEVYEHGEDDATADHQENGIEPTNLTEKGVKYAKTIGKQAAKQKKNTVISSDIERAVQTADIMANESGMQHITSPLLRTWNIGEYDGAPEGSFKEKQWVKNPNTAPAGGEPFSSFAQRMEQAYDMVKKAPSADDVVTHSKVTRAFKALESTGGQWTDKTTKKFTSLKDEPKTKAKDGMNLEKVHDNYGKQGNYNDASASTGPGFVGMSNDTTGRHYSPAWGGQFQNGGSLHNKAWVDSVNNANIDKDFVQRYYAKNNPPAPIHLSQTPSGEMSTHYMADADNMVFPTVVNPKTFNPLDVYTQPGNLQYLDKPGPVVDRKTAGDYARRTGEYIDFKNKQDAQWYANNGYKKGTDVLNSIDKGKAYNNPKYQMGGSMPGAVGFTYARTQDPAPDNGKYAKKTKASAQNGIEVKTNDPAFKNIDPSILKNINQFDINSVKSNMLEYLNSDLYKQRQKNIPEENFNVLPIELVASSNYKQLKEDYDNSFRNSIANIKRVGRYESLETIPTKINNIGLFADSYDRNNDVIHFNKKGTNAVIAHELTHSMFNPAIAEPQGLPDIQNSKFYSGKSTAANVFLNSGEQAYLNELIKRDIPNSKNDPHYDPLWGGSSADESYSDLMAFRQLLKDNNITKKFGDNITDKDFQKALKIKNIANDPNFKRMRLKYKDEHIPVLNNIIAKNEDDTIIPQAQNGTSTRKDLTEEEYYDPEKPTYKSGNTAMDMLSSNAWLMKLPIIGDKIRDEAYKQASKSNYPIRTNEEIEGKTKVAGEQQYLGTKGYQGVWNDDANDPNNVDLLRQYIYGDQNLTPSLYSPKDDYYKFLPSYSLKKRLSTNSTTDKAKRLSPVQLKDLDEVIKTHKPKFYHHFDTSDDPALSNIDTQVFYDKTPDLGHYRSGLGYDEDIDTPYAFVTDAWDFYPKEYEKDQHQDKENPTNNQEYQQSYLMHKVGKPYKIYDRTYIDPKTKEAVSDKEVFVKKQINKFSIPGISKEQKQKEDKYLWNLKGKSYNPNMQNGGEMEFYQNGLDFTPKSISKNGSVIKDDRGQWAHPGEITEINSNDITMKGVDYPVLGVSDEGDTKLMQPGKDYKFKGKKVTEYPMAKNGWLNKYK